MEKVSWDATPPAGSTVEEKSQFCFSDFQRELVASVPNGARCVTLNFYTDKTTMDHLYVPVTVTLMT